MRLPYILLLLLIAINTKAQNNLVPNGNFEQYTNCPTGLSQTSNSIGWRSYHAGTSDYFNTCFAGTPPGASVPTNFAGFQWPASGNTYVGGYCFNGFGASMYKEYVAGSITPLMIGAQYEVSMSVSLANFSALGSNDLGIFFYDNGPSSVSGSTLLPFTPQVSFASYGPIIDTQNWVRVSQTFVADSAYDNIVIGGFKGWSTIDTQRVKSGSICYYYIDSVVIKIVDSLVINFQDSMLCAGDSLIVPFFAISNFFTSNNIFTLQLSDASGSFSNPTALATVTGSTSGTFRTIVPSNLTGGSSYRLRVMASSPSWASKSNTKNIAIGNLKPAKPIAGSNTPACSGNNLLLTASSTSTGLTWSWKGPNNFTSNQQNPVIANPSSAVAGNYIVTATNYGCIARDTETVVFQVINPINTGSNSPICAGDTLKLADTASNTGETYSWVGPNGFTSNLKNPVLPTATVAASGDYIATVNINGCSIIKDTVAVVVNPYPTGLSTTSNSPVCEGDSLKLFGSSTTSGITYNWIGPSWGNTVASPVILNAVLGNSGKYYVEYAKGSCVSKDSVTVTIKPRPIAVTASNNGPICEGNNLQLSSTNSTSGAIYSWTGPNSYASSSQNPVITSSTLAMNGDYVVVATLNGCTVTDTTTLLVKPKPIATAANNGSICEDDILNLTATSTLPGSGFTWSGPASFTSTLQNPSISPAKPVNLGNYSVIATKDGCSSLPATTLAVVYPTPATPVPGANSIMCDASPLNLSTPYVPNALYYWTGPNAFTSNQQNPTINPATFINAGYYTLRISTNGCFSKKDSVNVTVNIIPRIGGYASPNDTICEGTLTTFVAKYNSGGNSPVFQWYKNYNAIPGANTLLYSTNKLVTGDIFYCTMYTVGVCTDPITVSTDTISIVVLPIVTQPSATITSAPAIPQPSEPVTFTAHVTNGGPLPKYQWQLNGVNQIGAIYATWSAATLRPFDKVNVMITSNDPCATNKVASSDTIMVGFPTAVNDVNKGNQFKIYPNPNNGNFRITAANISAQSVKLELINTIGQVVHKEQLKVTHNSIDQDIRLNDVSPGIYLLKVYDGDHVSTVKLTIK